MLRGMAKKPRANETHNMGHLGDGAKRAWIGEIETAEREAIEKGHQGIPGCLAGKAETPRIV
jgi:hypothetical protein